MCIHRIACKRVCVCVCVCIPQRVLTVLSPIIYYCATRIMTQKENELSREVVVVVREFREGGHQNNHTLH